MCGLFALLLGVGVFLTLRQPDNTPGVFLPAIYGSLGLFTASWWLVAAITFTIRGDQASDDGLPYGSDRNAVIAFSWLSAIDAFFVFVLVVHDRCDPLPGSSPLHSLEQPPPCRWRTHACTPCAAGRPGPQQRACLGVF
jgi:hypothetical protein